MSDENTVCNHYFLVTDLFLREESYMKISLKNIEKILERCTKKEIDFIIYIGQFQDEQGIIKGIDYKDVTTKIGISKSTFYKLLYGLEEKEIIEVCILNIDYGYWEVKIIDNIFACSEDYKKGYIKLNYKIFYSDDFKRLTKSEKIIVIHLIKIYDYRKNKIKITLRKIMEWTGKSMRSVRKFIGVLSKIFNIIVDGSLCLIDCINGFDSRHESETDIKNRHLIEFRLKKNNIQADEHEMKDTLIVLKQYKINTLHAVINLIDKTIDNFGTLMPRFTNKIASVLR